MLISWNPGKYPVSYRKMRIIQSSGSKSAGDVICPKLDFLPTEAAVGCKTGISRPEPKNPENESAKNQD